MPILQLFPGRPPSARGAGRGAPREPSAAPAARRGGAGAVGGAGASGAGAGCHGGVARNGGNPRENSEKLGKHRGKETTVWFGTLGIVTTNILKIVIPVITISIYNCLVVTGTLGIVIPTVTHSMIFQRGWYTTNQTILRKKKIWQKSNYENLHDNLQDIDVGNGWDNLWTWFVSHEDGSKPMK